MSTVSTKHKRLLLIDTCGETAGVALCDEERMLASEDLTPGSASAEILRAIRRLLTQLNWHPRDLHAIGVVRGPGSFTGIRTGLATAKGLCESLALPLASISRLEVLAEAAGLYSGFAALDAGRGELYLRDVASTREWLSSSEDLIRNRDGSIVAIAEPRLADKLAGVPTALHPLHVADALPAILRKLRKESSDAALANVAAVDANYVRGEEDIYQKSPSRPKPERQIL
ncbi:MAG: tRNA (adenosine(37)-N6)-threonylcarbamoyltransferase complex dimerization subunit type 1 TsaB [Acidobacteriaceae bacterium]